jgi:hypothetical protein
MPASHHRPGCSPVLVATLLALAGTAAAQPSQQPPPPQPQPQQPQPQPQQPQQPYPQQPQQPYPQQPQQPYPQQPYPYPPPQPYPYPPPQPYPPQQAYPPPQAYPAPPVGPREEPEGDLELIGDFAGLGILASATVLDVRDYDDPGTGTLIVIGGALGGGATGWILADRLDVKASEAHAATAGLGLGLLNGALLLVPLDQNDDIDSEQVLGTLLVGGTVGAGAGLAVGKGLRLTRGQSMFATNVALLGLGTSALVGALIDTDDGDLDKSEMLALTVGLDGGAAAGLLLAPKIKWSNGRARFVGAASLVGTFVGSMVGVLLATDKDSTTGSSSTDPDVAAISMLVGMWGGFAGGIAISSDWAPDPRFRQQTPPTPTGAASVTLAPVIGDGRLGVAAAGRF